MGDGARETKRNETTSSRSKYPVLHQNPKNISHRISHPNQKEAKSMVSRWLLTERARRYYPCALALAWQLVGCPLAWGHETGFLNRTLKLNGEHFRYAVYVPREWTRNRNTKWPVILFLHGFGEGGSDGLLPTEVGLGTAIRYNSERFPFIVVFPQLPSEQLWRQDASARIALAELDAEIKEFNGDSKRTYLTGLSMGAYGTWHIAAQFPGRFAAIAPIAGGIRITWDDEEMRPPDIYSRSAAQIGTTPVWMFHGIDDKTVPIGDARAMFEALQRSGGTVRYDEYEGVGHSCWDRAYSDAEFPLWLLQHRLGERGEAQAERRLIPPAPAPAPVDPTTGVNTPR
jgi:predicted esterase